MRILLVLPGIDRPQGLLNGQNDHAHIMVDGCIAHLTSSLRWKTARWMPGWAYV